MKLKNKLFGIGANSEMKPFGLKFGSSGTVYLHVINYAKRIATNSIRHHTKCYERS